MCFISRYAKNTIKMNFPDASETQRKKVIPIDKGWHFKQTEIKSNYHFAADWLPVSQFPTNVHLDLLHHNLIPDPFIGKNETKVQWVGETTWVYKTIFNCPVLQPGARADLVFQGLDTIATVNLNGTKILQTDNMFVPERVDITNVVKGTPVREFELVIVFESAYLRGWERVEEHPDHKWGCWNGDNSRLAVRKAQYHWGWDWGPTLLTCGPWRPVTLEIYESQFIDLDINIEFDSSLKTAKICAHAWVSGPADIVTFELCINGKEVRSKELESSQTLRPQTRRQGSSKQTHRAFRTVLSLEDLELWYPIGYGKQPLYTLTAILRSQYSDGDIDKISKRIGLRKAEVVQQPLEKSPGSSFFFMVNNIPIFCGGSNWIPADSFIPRITREKYYDWIRLLADGNQCMIRVWGGGIYEEDAFYDACDEMGILVWQDFMFACGNYPAWPEMLTCIRREARANIRLLRHHPSIVIWAGNNEDYQFQESEGLTYDPDDKDPESWLKTNFPARYIYEKILADACECLTPGTYYHFGSPWGGKNTRDPTKGDIHQWDVWHGLLERYQEFGNLVGRFVSEFGMQALPSAQTIDNYLPKGKNDTDRFSQSSTVDFHNKAVGHERRIAIYLAENFIYNTEPLEHFIYCTQLMQAECLATAYRLWRRQWKGEGKRYCGGALVWQLNDCWPGTSWSIFDYHLRPKYSYHAIKREMAPITVSIARSKHQPSSTDKHTRVGLVTKFEIEIWASNLTLKDLEVNCIVKAWDVQTGKELQLKDGSVFSGMAIVPANGSKEFNPLLIPWTADCNSEEQDFERRVIVAAYLFHSGQQIARCVNWPEPLKQVPFHLQEPKQLLFQVNPVGTLTIGANVPIKGFAMECDDDIKFDDNLVDIVPGEPIVVGIRGFTGQKILCKYYGSREDCAKYADFTV